MVVKSYSLLLEHLSEPVAAFIGTVAPQALFASGYGSRAAAQGHGGIAGPLHQPRSEPGPRSLPPGAAALGACAAAPPAPTGSVPAMALRLLRGAPGAASKRPGGGREGPGCAAEGLPGSPAPLPFLPQELTSEGTGRALPGAGGDGERPTWRRVEECEAPRWLGPGAFTAFPTPSMPLQFPCSSPLSFLPSPAPFGINILPVLQTCYRANLTRDVFLPCHCFILLNGSIMLNSALMFGE